MVTCAEMNAKVHGQTWDKDEPSKDPCNSTTDYKNTRHMCACSTILEARNAWVMRMQGTYACNKMLVG